MRTHHRNLGVLINDPLVSWEVLAFDKNTGDPVRFSSSGPGYLAPAQSYASLMSDGLTNPDSMGRFHRASPVDHITLLRGWERPKVVNIDFDDGPFIGTATFTLNGRGTLPWPVGGGVPPNYQGIAPTPPWSLINPWAKEAVEAMTSQFPRDVDLFNFIRELKELPQLLNMAKDIRDLSLAINGRLRNRPLSEVAASLHLGNEFGLAPLLGDIPKVLKIMDKVNKRLEWFRRNKGKWTRIGHRSPMIVIDHPYDSTTGLGTPMGVGARIVGVEHRFRLACSAHLRQDFPWLDDLQGVIRGIAGVAGLNKPLSVMWETIPFSWAVDYFLPISDFLDTFSFGDDVSWEFRDITWSSVNWHRLKILTETRSSSELVTTFDIKRYVRLQGFPPVSFWDFSFPDASQLALLAAVGATR